MSDLYFYKKPLVNKQTDILIVGAGPAGLACATKCQQLNQNFIIIESSNRVGGRLGSIYTNDYIFDLGFQVYNTSYLNTNKILNLGDLNLKFFRPGASIYKDNSFQILSDPLRNPSQFFSTMTSSFTTISDKLKILKLKYSLNKYKIKNDKTKDCSTYDFLKQYGFSTKIIDNFFKPFFSGIFLENDLKTSSKFFKYVFSKFNTGIAALPEKGMQAIPDQLLSNLENDNIILNKAVIDISKSSVKLIDDQVIHFNKLVLTGESSNLLLKSSEQYHKTDTIFFSTNTKINNGDYIHLFPDDTVINNIAFPTEIGCKYSQNNDTLISISLKNHDYKKLDLISGIQAKLSSYFGGPKSHYEYLKYMSIKKATLKQPSGYFQKNRTLRNGNIFLAGEKYQNGSIEGAVTSGQKILDLIV